MSAARDSQEKVLTVNRKAFHDYAVEETVEAGLVLTGTEIKSIRQGRMNLRDAYARIDGGEAWLVGMHISPYQQAGRHDQHEPDRSRKLLLHRDEIRRLTQQTQAKGMALVPLRLALRGGRVKVQLGLARGKKLYDKRQALAEREAQRDIERAVRGRG
ncbi:MAG: SsrA-binding protein SmpB [Chloroflexi bacterium]|nr:SsrA-binding protein SmpB [Chloroflexota bacterium]